MTAAEPLLTIYHANLELFKSLFADANIHSNFFVSALQLNFSVSDKRKVWLESRGGEKTHGGRRVKDEFLLFLLPQKPRWNNWPIEHHKLMSLSSLLVYRMAHLRHAKYRQEMKRSRELMRSNQSPRTTLPLTATVDNADVSTFLVWASKRCDTEVWL